MKIMHLADLHLGRSILDQSLISDQQYILDQIIEIIKEHNVETVIIAGDVYDKSIPSVEAVKLFSDFLTSLYKLSVKVLVISGNHDSKDRLSFGNELFVDNGVYIEGVFNGKLKCISLNDIYGNINFYMLPFVKPADVRIHYPKEEINSYDDAIRCIIDNTDIDTNERNIIMVHQFVTARGVEVERSDSETISLGGLDNIDVSIFSKFDYVAMGHIHGAQKLLRDTARYAGSPLKYSFSEVHNNKSVPIIDIKEKGNIDLELVSLVPIRDMRTIKGKFINLIDKDVVNEANNQDYIQAILTDDDYIVDVIGKLRAVYPNLLRTSYQNNRSIVNASIKNSARGDVAKRNEFDLFSEFYKNQNNMELDKERSKIISKIIKELKDN